MKPMVELYCFVIGCASPPHAASFTIMGCGQIIGGVACEQHVARARRLPQHHAHDRCGSVVVEFDIHEFRELHPESMSW